jgi:EmrB/QacA subfamily drug resistance transporter
MDARPLAFGAHRESRRHLHRPHVDLCSKKTALALLCVAQFMVILDVSIVNVALPSIRRDFHVSDHTLQWVVNAYTLAFGGFLLLGGRAADLLGRRRVFIAGLALFSIASLIGALSGSIGVLIAARALQGLGAACVSPATLSILTTVFVDPEERRHAMGVWGAVAAAGGAVGVVLGGVLIQVLSWSWVLFVNVPIGAAAILVALKAIRSEPPLEHAQFDIVGALTLTGGLVAIVFAIVSSRAWGLGSPDTLGVLALGVLLLLAFWVQESRLTTHPLVPLRIFASRHLTAANVVMFFIGCAMYSAFFFVTLYLQEVRGYSPLVAGVAFLPLSVGIMVGSTAATRLTGWLGPMVPLVGGLALAAVGMLLFTTLEVTGTFTSQVLIPSLILGVGIGIAFVPATIAAVTGVPEDLAGLAAGLANMSRSVGGSLGLAALATIAATRTDQILAKHTASPHVVHAALTSGYTRAFGIGALLLLAGAVTALFALPWQRRRHEQRSSPPFASGRHLPRPEATRSRPS